MADAKKLAEHALQRVADKGLEAGVTYIFSATNSNANKPIRGEELALVSPELRDAWHTYEAAKEKTAKGTKGAETHLTRAGGSNTETKCDRTTPGA